MTFTWEFDAPAGVYKDHALSKKLLLVAARQWKFVPFTQKITDYSAHMGQSITLIYYNPLDDPVSAQLDEHTRVPVDKLTTGKTSITIKEWGRGVEYTNFARQLSVFDPKIAAQKALIDQMNQSMDVAAASEFTGSDMKVKFIPTTAMGGTFDTDGTPSTQALVNLNVDHMAMIRDYMVKDLHVPFFDGDHYMGLFATKAMRGIKQDRRFEQWHQYLRKGDLLFRGEVGMAESIRAVEVTNDRALSNSLGASNVLGEGVIFGDEAVGRIEIEFPHLRAQPNYTSDFGRKGAVCWLGTVAFGVKFPVADDRKARGVHISSS